MEGRRYEVGQTLYVVMVDKLKIVPVLVAEEVVRKTLQGEEVTYLVCHKEASDPIDLRRLKGDVYEDLEEVKTLLVDNVTRNITNMCDQVDSRSKELKQNLFGGSLDRVVTRDIPVDQPEVIEEDNVFVLEDGTRARVKF
ncbi:MAG: hypothetical protein ACXABN_19115 [Candidatus Thorarchaeota archaeon]